MARVEVASATADLLLSFGAALLESDRRRVLSVSAMSGNDNTLCFMAKAVKPRLRIQPVSSTL
jgi:hypothetical protein